MGEIDTAAKRAKLRARKNPYWQGLAGGRGGVSLGYRKPARGVGSWIAKFTLDGARVEERLGAADDHEAPFGALSFASASVAAINWAKQQAEIADNKDIDPTAKAPTVRSAVAKYISHRQARSKSTGANAKSRLELHVLSDEKFSGIHLAKLRVASFDAWRERLPGDLAKSSVNRLQNDLRAALNRAVEKHRRELPASLPLEIKLGTRAVETEEATVPKRLLTDQQIRAAVSAAFEIDENFGYTVMLAAATGARYSQLAALKVLDVQKPQLRIMVPASKKGRSRKARPNIAVPVGREVVMALAPLCRRPADEFLLRRWAYKRKGRLQWERDRLRPLGQAYEAEEQWAAVVRKARLPADAVMYSLRHSSIVRALRKNLPVRLVAALHDTSIEMIEKHYAAFIVDVTEDITRRSIITLPSAGLQAAE
ncbi:tyrosine-type recombinase/integrase [Bradyrhizobium brasilense]|uniref:tyrosine-type recombinase/integrase n=1 Tax=Bradyrhizobium brasilense TaxID=1419277 RepID=UPI0028778C63|nr:tyrosine-type recombinase/integrase [Bradyrhizobium brasilense]MCP3417784.1 tyrosine-type recombinase/integrase [Bradyrhizobium brasilense]